jgi:hypothetical protein
MTEQRSRVTLDEVYAVIGSLVDYIKVLVTAVDDLRCEIEWQARNPAVDHANVPSAATSPGSHEVAGEVVAPRSSDQEIAFESLLTATGRLQAFEKLLYQAPRGLWLDEFASEDDFIIPEGRIFSVDADLWTSILDVRPAHVVGDSCCCEAGEGTPFLLAWQTEREFLLRELTYEEARRLQEFCLACQAERADAAIQEAQLLSTQSQLGLF